MDSQFQTSDYRHHGSLQHAAVLEADIDMS